MKNQEHVGHISVRERQLVVGAALSALFLGALDALVMSAAMPSIVADLGGLALYAWVYSAYFLASAVSLPIFGKLADIYAAKKIFLFCIALFTVSSTTAGLADTMFFLIVNRVLQGVGAGGIFALVYIVLSRVALPGERARTLSFASLIWGIASVIGPTLGGFIVTYLSWRWIFFINIPIGTLSFLGIAFFLHSRQKQDSQKKAISMDLAGLFCGSAFILGMLVIFITGGKEIAWNSINMVLLVGVTAILAPLFYWIEKKAVDPMIDLRFFKIRNFTLGNGAVFLASFTIFSFFAYVPLFIQAGLGFSPLKVGLAMVAISLGWSFGALYFGRICPDGSEKLYSTIGGVILCGGTLLTTRFDLETAVAECFFLFLLVGVGMGFVSLTTLILVQNSVSSKNLGVVTSFHQLSRSLGGTVGVGICGGLVTTGLLKSLETASVSLPETVIVQLEKSSESVLQPEFQSLLPAGALEILRSAVIAGVFAVFVATSIASLCCLLCCLLLTQDQNNRD